MTENIPALLQSTSSDTDSKEYQLSTAGYKVRIFTSVNQLPSDWDHAMPINNFFLQRPYLTVLEEAPPQNIRFAYLIIYKNNHPAGVVYCQITRFRTEKSVQEIDGKHQNGLVGKMTASVKTFVAKKFEFTLLVCGNLLLTGEHGFYFSEKVNNGTNALCLVEEALVHTQSFLAEKGVPCDGIFIKDLEEKQLISCQVLKENKFREFTFHPNMVLHIRPEWNSFDDYMDDISSKYKVRARKAFKDGESIVRKELTYDQIKTNLHRLYELYKGVMSAADFNMVVLHENYIVKLKELLGDHFMVTGYYLNGELIGYKTNIFNYDEIEAHFLGYEPSLNRSHKLYMNMLYDSLILGIEKKVKRVVYARTAMEIKSSIGCEPHQMYCYIRANKSLINSFLSPLLEYFRPEDDWTQRNPFKEKP